MLSNTTGAIVDVVVETTSVVVDGNKVPVVISDSLEPLEQLARSNAPATNTAEGFLILSFFVYSDTRIELQQE
jgi:hypothetical protein